MNTLRSAIEKAGAERVASSLNISVRHLMSKVKNKNFCIKEIRLIKDITGLDGIELHRMFCDI